MRLGLRELLFLAVLFGIPLAAYQYVFQPRNEEINQAREEIARKRERLDQLTEATSRIDDLGAAIEEQQEAITIVEAKLPSEQNVDEVLRQAWKIARRHDLTIRTVEPKNRVPALQYMELPIEVKLAGNFDGFYEFLRDLEQLPRLTRIKEMRLKRLDDENGAMEASFVLSIYFEPIDDDSTLAEAN